MGLPMSPEDLRLFCTALGFTAVVMRGDAQAKGNAARAAGFAHLIEAFCLRTLSPANQDDPWNADEVIESMKSDLRGKGEADMDKNRDSLLRLYDNLRRRYIAYASDDMIADRVLELLDAEIAHEDRRADDKA